MFGQNYRVTVTGTIQGWADVLPEAITRHIDEVNRDLRAGVTDFSIDSIEPLESLSGGYGAWSWSTPSHRVTVSGTMPGWSAESVWESVEDHFHGLQGTVIDFTIVSVEEIETEVPAARPVTETVAVSGKRRWVRRLFGATARAN